MSDKIIKHGIHICRGICPVLLVFLIGCIKSMENNRDLGYIRGTITDPAGKPAEDAQVYVYKWLYDTESIEKIIREEMGDEGLSGSGDYGAYRGPADFKSAKTGMNGEYKVGVPTGTYCLVARKRHNRDITEGPLNPEDTSSLVSEPVFVEGEKAVRVSLKLLDTLRDASFFDRYLVRTYRTGFSGRVITSAGTSVGGVVVTADEDGSKIGRRADFTSSSTDREGNYILYVFYGGDYHPGVKRRASGPDLPFRPRDESENNIVSVPQGRIISGVDLVLDADYPSYGEK
jgi:hypothetical protein